MTFCASCGNFIDQANFCPHCGTQNIQYNRGLQQPQQPPQTAFLGGNVIAIQNPLYQQQNLLGGNFFVAQPPQVIIVNKGNACRHCGQQCTPKRGRDLYGNAIKNSSGQQMWICSNTGKSWHQ